MILILGGTAEARALAAGLTDDGFPVTSSLAGRVTNPALPQGEVRVGGFGGAPGLTDYLRRTRITAVVDATHPFAAKISAHAVVAAAQARVPLLRLERPGWSDHPGARNWTWVADAYAARAAADQAQRPFLSTGRQSLATFLPWSDRHVVARMVDPPEFQLPPVWTLIRSRGPYTVDSERRLMLDHRIDALLTKDSGGRLTEAKLTAAEELGIPVVVIARPPSAGAPTVPDVTAAREWVRSLKPH